MMLSSYTVLYVECIRARIGPSCLGGGLLFPLREVSLLSVLFEQRRHQQLWQYSTRDNPLVLDVTARNNARLASL
jgi:hypothetical protein